MKFEIISLFPEMFLSLTEHGVVGRALTSGKVSLSVINPRQFTNDQRATVDDRPYGGGPGMVMMAEPLAKAIAAARAKLPKAKVVYLSPQGKKFDHQAASSLAARDSLILLAGRYEGVDERLLESDVDEQYSIGDFVLSGGELPAMVMIDAMVRLLPESLGNEQSASQDSFVDGLLDCPHYTRPEVYQGRTVPKVLLSGDHKAIARWREQQSLGRTWLFRPDLLEKIELDERQQALLTEFKNQL